ncbi:MAG TPA: DUF5658 family protein [Candidatus Syntrophosphaera sp.]|nr:DUF5658 family protein [Candidatus Syntrophosphaera sp.]
MLTTLVALYSILVALNLLDGFSTWLVLKPNHYHRERNPAARWMFIKLGLTRGLVLAEVLWIGFISAVFFLTFTHPIWNVALLVLLCVGVLVFLRVVSGNFRAWQSIWQREELLAGKQQKEEADVGHA